MTKKQRILLSVAVILLLSLLFFTATSEHGFVDLQILTKEQDRLIDENKRISMENHSIGVEIDRLKHDPEYIENIARQELGMIGENEVILKPRKSMDRRAKQVE